MSGPADRRAWPRSPLVVRGAQCLLGKEVFFGCALNVSRGGLFISSVRRRPVGEVCAIRFGLPELPGSFHCQARVVWSRPFAPDSPLSPGFGLEFLDLAEGARQQLEAWVLRRLAEDEEE